MQDLLQNGTSRYKEEFVEIIRLGKGGFGSVFKVCDLTIALGVGESFYHHASWAFIKYKTQDWSYFLFFSFKVKNKLDGREYAVKKVPLKETNPDLCLKVYTKIQYSTNSNCTFVSHMSFLHNYVCWTLGQEVWVQSLARSLYVIFLGKTLYFHHASLHLGR